MVGLETSRWASGAPRPTPATIPARLASRADELERHRRLLRRLRWKLPYLADSHRRATVPTVDMSETDKREAELMFKLDFFDYYVLLEKALLHLYGVFGITVSAYSNDVSSSGWNGAAIPSSSVPASIHSHRFHENVLRALDSTTNPLHNILGVGDVRKQLAAAKELRNRWKDADERALLSVDKAAPETASPPPLSGYEIEHMLGSIFTAFDEAQDIADKAVRETTGTIGAIRHRRRRSSLADAIEMDASDSPLEFLSDPMDWEAIS